MKVKPKREQIVLFLFIVIVLIYRACVIFFYDVRFLDDDQALMWNGVAAFAHFTFPEPCFWGQAYGSMFESLIAVPLYWMHAPMNYAMPIAMFAVSFFPYLFVSILLYKNNHIEYSYLVLMLYLLMGWKWDILTSVSRSFISGIPFATLGTILLNNKKSSSTAFLGAILACLGVIMTNTAAVVSGMGFLFFCWNIRKKYEKIVPVSLGCVVSAIIYIAVKKFYEINADFSLHPETQLELSIEVLKNNLQNLSSICNDFIFSGTGEVVLLIIGVALIYSIAQKRWLTTAMILADFIVMVLIFSLTKTMDYGENSVLFSQTRMFLCWSFSWILILYFDAEQYGTKNVLITKNYSRIIGMVIVLALVGILFGKIVIINANIKKNESSLNNPYGCGHYETKEVMKAATMVDAYATEQNADVIVTRSDCRSLSYVIDAMYYGKYTVYNIVYDRRTWNYHYLEHIQPHRVLFVDYAVDNCNMEIVDISDKSVVNYIIEQYGKYRNPYLNQ